MPTSTMLIIQGTSSQRVVHGKKHIFHSDGPIVDPHGNTTPCGWWDILDLGLMPSHTDTGRRRRGDETCRERRRRADVVFDWWGRPSFK
jgi:hypothetical protein